ncbi:hypothetical protein [Phreatobacter stygius]|uniref:Uncharacterized protein n=1 Tax=Phreatobacter stygius TaxID=1940610 RepID=A0A4D7B2X7_9HYPH|nr:hypothetical protein [Phreatobacter stygius]QCI65403.1 hypothetical protein E8M01_15010 [Phreatobacter stygius]
MHQPPFPTRPLKVLLPKRPSRLGAFALFLTGVLFVAGIAFLMGPDLVKDARLVGNVEPATQARFISGKCKSKLVLHFCDATIERRGPAGNIREETSFGFFDLHLGAYSIRVMQQKGNPNVVTTDLALDHFWNRLITVGLFVALFGAGALASLRQAVRRRTGDPNKPLRALSGKVLSPLLVDLRGEGTENGKTWTWTYARPMSGPAFGPETAVDFPAGLWPFFVDQAGSQALAAGGPNGEVLLLDGGLTVLDMRPEERQRLFDWHAASLAEEATRQQPPAYGAATPASA